MLIWAAAADAWTEPGNGWPQLGVYGAVMGGLIWFAKSSVARERSRADKADATVDELNKFIRDTLLQQNIENNLIHQQVTEALSESVEKLREGKAAPRPGSRRGGE